MNSDRSGEQGVRDELSGLERPQLSSGWAFTSLSRAIWRFPRYVSTIVSGLAMLLILSQVLAEKAASIRPGPISIAAIDPDGRIICSTPTPTEFEALDHLIAENRTASGSFTYSSSRDGGIRLQFVGAPLQVQEAIIHGASLWEEKLVIDVPFILRFYWETSEELQGYGGIARSRWETGPDGSYSCLPELNGYCVPNTLANQLLGYRVKGSDNPDPEYEIYLNSGIRWHIDPTTDSIGQLPDLTMTVMHEIGHALGFDSGHSLNESDETATLVRLSGSGKTGFLYYNYFIWNPSHGELIHYWDSPSEIYDVLTHHRILWGDLLMRNSRGEELRTWKVNGGPVLLMTSYFNPSLNVIHLDDWAFDDTGPDNVMTAYDDINRDEQTANRRIGPVTLAMLYDMGWELKDGALREEICDLPERSPVRHRNLD